MVDFRDAGRILDGDKEIQEIYDEKYFVVYEKDPVQYLLSAENWQGNKPTINNNTISLSAVRGCYTNNFTTNNNYLLEFDWQPATSDQRSYIRIGFDYNNLIQTNQVNRRTLRFGGDISSTNYFTFNYFDENGTQTYTTSKFNINATTWHHVQIRRNNQYISIWIDDYCYLDNFEVPLDFQNTMYINKWQRGTTNIKNIKYYGFYKKSYFNPNICHYNVSSLSNNLGRRRHPISFNCANNDFYMSCEMNIVSTDKWFSSSINVRSSEPLYESEFKTWNENGGTGGIVAVGCGISNGSNVNSSLVVKNDSSVTISRNKYYKYEVYRYGYDYFGIISDSDTGEVLSRVHQYSEDTLNWVGLYSFEGCNLYYKNVDFRLLDDYAITTYEDAGSSDNVSRFEQSILNNNSFSFDSTENAYKMQVTDNKGFGTVLLKDVYGNCGNSFRISCDVKHNGTYYGMNSQPRVGVFNTNTQLGVLLMMTAYEPSNNIRLRDGHPYMAETTPTSLDTRISSTFNTSTWYHMELLCSRIDDDLYYVKCIFNNDVIVFNNFVNGDFFSNKYKENVFGVTNCYDIGAITWFKNIKIEDINILNIKPNYLISDDASSDNLSQYDIQKFMYDNDNALQTFTYDSDNSCYKVNIADTYPSGSNYIMKLTKHEMDREIILEADSYSSDNDMCDFGFGLIDVDNHKGNFTYLRNQTKKRFTKQTAVSTWNHPVDQTISSTTQIWLKHTMIIKGLEFRYIVKKKSDNSIIWDYSNTFDTNLTSKDLGIITGWHLGGYQLFKNIKVQKKVIKDEICELSANQIIECPSALGGSSGNIVVDTDDTSLHWETTGWSKTEEFNITSLMDSNNPYTDFEFDFYIYSSPARVYMVKGNRMIALLFDRTQGIRMVVSNYTSVTSTSNIELMNYSNFQYPINSWIHIHFHMDNGCISVKIFDDNRNLLTKYDYEEDFITSTPVKITFGYFGTSDGWGYEGKIKNFKMYSKSILLSDTAEEDRTDNYYSSADSFTHENDYYVVTHTGTEEHYYSHIYTDEKNILPLNYEISVDMNLIEKQYNVNNVICIGNEIKENMHDMADSIIFGNFSGTKGLSYRYNNVYNGNWRTSGTLSLNRWYNYKVIVNGTNIRGVITDLSNNNVVYDKTYTYDNLTSYHKWAIALGDGGKKMYVRNIRVTKKNKREIIDNCTADKTSNYFVENGTLSFDNNCYKFESNQDGVINIGNNFENFEFEVDLKGDFGKSWQIFESSNNILYTYDVENGNKIGLCGVIDGSWWTNRVDNMIDNTNWWKFKIKMIDGVVTSTIESEQGVEVHSQTYTWRKGLKNLNIFKQIAGVLYIKNIKIKEL